jgi:hypothetical protein
MAPRSPADNPQCQQEAARQQDLPEEGHRLHPLVVEDRHLLAEAFPDLKARKDRKDRPDLLHLHPDHDRCRCRTRTTRRDSTVTQAVLCFSSNSTKLSPSAPHIMTNR